MSTTTADLQPQPSGLLDGSPPAGPTGPPNRRHQTAIIAAAAALLLAGIAVGAVVLTTSNTHRQPAQQAAATAYQEKATAALAPVIAANQFLSTALQAIDGSSGTLHNANSAVALTQTAVTGARGAIATLTVPPSQTTLSQQIQQALIQENGYLQAVQATLSDPVGQSASQVRTLATNTQSAFVAIAPVAPGGTASISGIDNFMGWVSGANAQANGKSQKPPVIIQNNNPTTTVTSPPPPVPSNPTAGMVNQGAGIWSTSGISNALANNVFYRYWLLETNGGDASSFQAWSAATGQWYSVSTSSDGTYVYASVAGTNDPNAEIILGWASLNAYTTADAQAYANSPNAGP
jgi:hypothetical protein